MNQTICELPDCNPASAEIIDMLKSCTTIAVVGLSPKAVRDSHRVARYLIEQGYEVIPVNPGQREILGRTCYRTLGDIPFPVDMADLFLNPAKKTTLCPTDLNVPEPDGCGSWQPCCCCQPGALPGNYCGPPPVSPQHGQHC